MSVNRHKVSMVVAERGSDWKPWVHHFEAEESPVVVIHQYPRESCDSFALRVRSEIAALERAEKPLARAVIVGGQGRGWDALAARSLAIRALASGMSKTGGGCVWLHSHGKDRFSMSALASAVADLIRGTGVSVTCWEDACEAAIA